MRNILLPTDGSTPAMVATIKAVEMAKERGATLVILKVVEQAPRVDIERIAEASALMRPAGEDGVKYAEELAAMDKVPTKVVVREGPVVGEIIRTAEEEGSELIVLGTSSLKGLNRLYLGSVAKAVVSQAPTSVVVIKPTPEEIKHALTLIREVVEESPEKAVRSIIRTRQFRIGVYLFAAYAIGYAAFIITGSYFKDLFKTTLLGMNLGTVVGILIIFVTIALAVGFNWYATRAEEAS
ncbi:MAG: universal stress protein [Methanomassiliicoccus sp.]|nr:universal stress protein [Methanomassiliicoccus sp.]